MIKTSGIVIVAITKKGRLQALRLKKAFKASKLYMPSNGGLSDLTKKLFFESEGIIFCMALGIVVRAIAPYIRNKYADPAVVAVDDTGSFAISVLSGHEGGANNLAIQASNTLGACPVVTTASEVSKNIIIGIGCRRGIEKKEIIKAIFYAITKTKHSLRQIRYIATVDLKKDEPGLADASMELGIPLRVIPFDEIKNFKGYYQKSDFVRKKIGIEGVSEPCALLAGRNTRLILPKTRLTGITIAISRED